MNKLISCRRKQEVIYYEKDKDRIYKKRTTE